MFTNVVVNEIQNRLLFFGEEHAGCYIRTLVW
jgi:hypothetical protein